MSKLSRLVAEFERENKVYVWVSTDGVSFWYMLDKEPPSYKKFVEYLIKKGY